jgi:hypothetical protein
VRRNRTGDGLIVTGFIMLLAVIFVLAIGAGYHQCERRATCEDSNGVWINDGGRWGQGRCAHFRGLEMDP